jgi:hypothetical protein
VGILLESLHVLNAASPFLLFGFFVAGLMKMWIPDRRLMAHMGGTSLWSIVKASLIGVPIPLCSCGVLPAAIGLKKQGAGNGAVTAFMISTPETGVDSMAVTWALIDPLLTVIRPVTAFITATVAGLLVNRFPGEIKGEADEEKTFPPTPCACSECCGYDETRQPDLKTRAKGALRYAFIEMVDDIGVWMLVGVVIAGMISYWVPVDYIHRYIESEFLSLVMMLVIGIPLYVCATASTPIAASLLMKGLSPGAALVFLMAGPATNVATITVLLRVIGKKSTALYLVAIALCSLVLGWLTNRIYDFFQIDIAASVGRMTEIAHGPLSVICSVVFLLLIASRWLRGRGGHEHV